MQKVIIFFLLFLGSCANVVTIDSKTDNTGIRIAAGDIASIELESQISTGYNWIIVESESFIFIDRRIVESPAAADDPQTGKKEKQILRFRAAQKGKGTITLNYIKQWEKGTKPEKIFSRSFIIE